RELWSQYRSTPTARPKRAAWAIPPYLWRNSVFEVSVLASLTLAMAMLGALYYVPIFSQGVMGLFVVNSGFLLIPLDIGIIEVSAANGFLISKTGRFTPQMLVDVPLDVVAGISAGLHASFRPLLLACLAFVTATMLFTVLL